MTRMSPADRLDVIIDAALAVMLRKGMASTTVRDVAEEMGTSSGLIHHYVASMDELLAAAFERAAGQDLVATRAAMAAGAAGSAGSAGAASAEWGPVQRLARFFDGYARADQDWAFQLWLDAWAEAARPAGGAGDLAPAQRRVAGADRGDHPRRRGRRASATSARAWPRAS